MSSRLFRESVIFMKLYRLSVSQRIPVEIAEAWAFFSQPTNLARITPPSLSFEITGDTPEKMYAGLIISYRVRPLWGIPQTWVSEISQVNEPHFFVDEQLAGPYRVWHHQHRFIEESDGTRVEDIVHYALPMGVLGRAIHPLLVRPKLREIFTYREAAITSLFGEPNDRSQI